MNRFMFTCLIFAKLVISIHFNIVKENAYAYNKVDDEVFKPIVIGHEVDKVMDDDMKKSLGSSLINLADTSTKSVEYYYYGNLLNTFEKKIYAELGKICQTPITNFTTDWLDVTQYKIDKSKLEEYICRAANAFKVDHTEYWWINGGLSYLYYPNAQNNNVNRLQITLDNNGYSKNYINNNYDKVLNIAKTVANAAKKQNTIYKRIKYIHDYLVTNIKYGYKTNDYSRHSTLGALINKRCTCQGYADTFTLICRLAGIEAIRILGTANNGAHAWNYVKIDNVWYLVDVTFDDPGDEEPGVASENHTFFLIGWGDHYYKENYGERTAVYKGLRYPTLSETNYKRPNLA